MFLLIGIDRKEEQLDFDQLDICPVCGRYGRAQVFMSYTCFTLFFIPLFKWDRQYYVRMGCCGAEAPLSPEAGKLVRQGRAERLRLDKLGFSHGNGSGNAARGAGERCPGCGSLVAPGYRFCPYCGRRI